MKEKTDALQGMGRSREWIVKIAICCAGYGLFSDNVVVPLVNAIMNEFTDTSTFLLNYIVSGNAIAGLFTGLITGLLLKKMRRKPLLVFGTVLFVLGGIGGVFCENLELLAVMRTIDSASDGILTVTTAAMIVELWKSEKDQGFVFGLYNTVSSLFGAIASVFAGYMAVTAWRSAFWINALGMIAVVLCIIYVPDTKPSDPCMSEEEPEEEWEKNLKWRPGRFVFGMLTLNTLQTVSYMIVMLLDVYVAEQGIGNSIVTGYMGVVALVFGAIGNMSASGILSRFKQKKLFVALFSLVFAALFVILAIGCRSVGMLILCMAMNIIAQSWLVIYYEVATARSVPKRQRTVCISIMIQSTYIDAVLCPFLPVLTEKIFGTQTIAQSCFYCAVLCGIFTLIYFVVALAVKNEDYSYA